MEGEEFGRRIVRLRAEARARTRLAALWRRGPAATAAGGRGAKDDGKRPSRPQAPGRRFVAMPPAALHFGAWVARLGILG
jgi:hypothetical protein